MLATGGSAEMAISYLRERGVKDIRMLCIVAAPEGPLKSDQKGQVLMCISIPAPSTTILNGRAAYIVPGLATPATASTAALYARWAKTAAAANTKKRCARIEQRRRAHC